MPVLSCKAIKMIQKQRKITKSPAVQIVGFEAILLMIALKHIIIFILVIGKKRTYDDDLEQECQK